MEYIVMVHCDFGNETDEVEYSGLRHSDRKDAQTELDLLKENLKRDDFNVECYIEYAYIKEV